MSQGFAPFRRRLTLAVALVLSAPATSAQVNTLRVMSFNAWGAGGNEGKRIDDTVAAIRAANADIVGLQETRVESASCAADHCPPAGASAAAAVAAALGFQVHEQQAANPALWANAIITRYPIRRVSTHDLGVQLDLGGCEVWIFNVHLPDAPYQPYQAAGIKYGSAPLTKKPTELVSWARRARGAAVDLLLAELAQAHGAAAVLVTGDFNEPSYLDWTAATVAAGVHPVAVRWPSTRRLAAAGFVDAFRRVHPDTLARPGFTWTPKGKGQSDPEEHHDRIDFVFARGAQATGAWIVGEPGPRSDIAVNPWPSDHRAVVVAARIQEARCAPANRRE